MISRQRRRLVVRLQDSLSLTLFLSFIGKVARGGRRGDWLSPEKGEAEVRNLRACVCLCQPVKSWCVCTLDGQGRNVAPGKVVFWRDQHNYDWITGNLKNEDLFSLVLKKLFDEIFLLISFSVAPWTAHQFNFIATSYL